MDAMVDLETMGTGSDAAITAIGAAAFDVEKGVQKGHFYRVVDLASSVAGGGTMTPSTVLWWMKQSDAARAEFSRPGVMITQALGDFTEWCTENSIVGIWGNGATFDNVILRNAYDRAKIPAPWSYSKDRCYRTLRALHPDIVVPSVGTAHNAVNDAEYQALMLIEILKEKK